MTNSFKTDYGAWADTLAGVLYHKDAITLDQKISISSIARNGNIKEVRDRIKDITSADLKSWKAIKSYIEQL